VAKPQPINEWPPTSLKEKRIKIGAKRTALSCRKAGKTPAFTLVRGVTWELRVLATQEGE
jgi:hypothetical protein